MRRLALLLVVALAGLLAPVAVLRPYEAALLAEEDDLLETAQALLFAASSVLLLVSAQWARREPSAAVRALVGLALAAVFLREVDVEQKGLGWRIVDMRALSGGALDPGIRVLALVLMGALAAAIGVYAHSHRATLARGVADLFRADWGQCLAAGLGLFAAVQPLEAALAGAGLPGYFLEESLELAAALVVSVGASGSALEAASSRRSAASR